MKLQTSSRFARGPFSHLRNPRRPRGGQEQSAGDSAPGRYCWLFCFLLPLTLSLESFGRKQVAWWRPTENFQPSCRFVFVLFLPGKFITCQMVCFYWQSKAIYGGQVSFPQNFETSNLIKGLLNSTHIRRNSRVVAYCGRAEPKFSEQPPAAEPALLSFYT